MNEQSKCPVCEVRDIVSASLELVRRGEPKKGEDKITELLSENNGRVGLLGLELLSRAIGGSKPEQNFVLKELYKIEGQVEVDSFRERFKKVKDFIRGSES